MDAVYGCSSPLPSFLLYADDVCWLDGWTLEIYIVLHALGFAGQIPGWGCDRIIYLAMTVGVSISVGEGVGCLGGVWAFWSVIASVIYHGWVICRG